jgi:signal transduction histidine kinase
MSWVPWAKRVALGVCFWTAVAIVAVLPHLSLNSDWRASILSSQSHWWSWGLLTPLIMALDKRLLFSIKPIFGRVLVHLLLGAIFAVVYAYVSACVAAALGVGQWSQIVDAHFLGRMSHEMFWSVLVYGLIVGVSEAHLYRQRYVSAELRMERLERNFSEARLNNLRMQLDPHFLFNALNTISSQVEREPRLARRMIEHLGDLLRLSLSSQSKSEMALAEELLFLDHYLAIQKIRFGKNLRVEINVSADVKHALVPSMFLQPLVENAIRHGISPRAGGGSILISALRVGDRLQVRVSDDGVGLPVGGLPRHQAGLGLAVTRERIAGMHPDGTSHFSIHPRPEGGTEVEICFPLRLIEGIHDRRIA